PRFPAMPRVPPPSSTVGPLSTSEIEHGRLVENMFQQTDITSAPSSSVGVKEEVVDDVVNKLTTDELIEALTLHAQLPQLHTPSALADRFGLAPKDVPLLEAALEHCLPYEVVKSGDVLFAIPPRQFADTEAKDRAASQNDKSVG
ncbi:MAG: hypothetical protein SGPRY_008932, partial [Prymnesium sp.]